MSTLSIQPAYPIFTDTDGQPLEDGFVWVGAPNLDPQTNPISVYLDADLALPAVQPIRTLAGYPVNSRTPARLYVNGDYSIRVMNKKGSVVYSAPAATERYSGIVIGAISALNVKYDPAGVGAVQTDVQAKFHESTNAVTDFGADNTGATNATIALLNFFTHCVNTGTPGHIPSGDYLVTAGVLTFDNGFADRIWPYITTDGYDTVTFLRADATDAPMITLSNGTATSGSGNYWNGGSLGGITFDQNGKTTGSSQHGLSLRGIWGTKFGWMRANNAGGSCVYLPEKLYAVTNPDPYAVTFCEFEGVEANRCRRFAFENRNWLGFNGCRIKSLRAIETTLGGLWGFGTANTVEVASMGSCAGWAFNDGTEAGATGGAPLRFTVNQAELDDVQYGIYLNRTTMFDFHQIRFIHRFNFGPLNSSGGYWPRIAVSVSGGTSPNVYFGTIDCVHRIEAGGTKPDIGVFANGNNNPNATDIKVNQYIIDSPGFGFTNSDYFTAISTSSSVLITKRGLRINDTTLKVAALVRSATTATIPNTGFSTIAAKIIFATVMSDRGGYYNTADSSFTVPFTGLYRVSGKICFAAPVGVRTRIAFAADNAGVVTIFTQRTYYVDNVAAKHYTVDGVVLLTVGQKIFLMADQNTTGVINLSTPSSATADLTWSIEAL